MNTALNRKQVYGIIAILFVVCLSLSVLLSLQSSVNASTEEQKTENSTEVTATPEPTPAPTNQTVDGSTSTLAPTPQPTPYAMTENETLAMATPLIEQYASENNRTITSIKATFYPSVKDLGGTRGGASLTNGANPNSYFLSYPEWSIEATFNSLGYPGMTINGTLPTNPQCYIYGFTVCIWADNGQINGSGPQGWD